MVPYAAALPQPATQQQSQQKRVSPWLRGWFTAPAQVGGGAHWPPLPHEVNHRRVFCGHCPDWRPGPASFPWTHWPWAPAVFVLCWWWFDKWVSTKTKVCMCPLTLVIKIVVMYRTSYATFTNNNKYIILRNKLCREKLVLTKCLRSFFQNS